MKRQLVLGVSTGIILGVLSPIFVNAQQPRTAPTNPNIELNARLEARKNKLQTRLNNDQAAKLSGRCVGAQQKLVGISKKFSESDRPLRAKYDAYAVRLQKITQKAEERGIDTADLKKNTELFKQKHQDMVAAINEFNVSISDLQAADCRTNPTGFKATLDSARTSLAEVQAARAELAKLAKGPLQESIKAVKLGFEKREN